METIYTKPKFKYLNPLAEEALAELRVRLTEVDLKEIDFHTHNLPIEDVLKVYKVHGEPSFGEQYIIVKKGKELLLELFSGDRILGGLTKNEWQVLLNPSPSNLLLLRYFKKLHNAFKTNAKSNGSFTSAYEELLQKLREKYEKNQTK